MSSGPVALSTPSQGGISGVGLQRAAARNQRGDARTLLSELQVRAMLNECEARMGRPLASLRSKLLRQRNPAEPIWELVNIHAALKVGDVTEESHAEPDIRLSWPSGDVVWIEATHVSARDQALLEDVHTFPNWIRRELELCGLDPRMQIRLDQRVQRYGGEMVVPPRNRRRALKGTSEWREFVRNVKASRVGKWDPGSGYNVVVKVTPGPAFTSSYPTVGIPRRPEDHVLYRAIKSKAAQILDRPQRGTHQPLILSVCASHPSARMESMGPGTSTARNAVTAALADTRGWDNASLHNFIGPGNRRGMQISGAEYISGVLVTELQEPLATWSREHGRHARSRLFLNQSAGHPLGDSIRAQLRGLHFNHYKYGPQWGEHWRDPLDDADEQDDRRARDVGSIKMGLGRDAMSIELPTSLLLRVLSGKVPAKEAFDKFGSDVFSRLQSAFSEGREIEAIEVVPADPATRKSQSVKIVVGPPIPPVLAVRKKKESGQVPRPRET